MQVHLKALDMHSFPQHCCRVGTIPHSEVNGYKEASVPYYHFLELCLEFRSSKSVSWLLNWTLLWPARPFDQNLGNAQQKQHQNIQLPDDGHESIHEAALFSWIWVRIQSSAIKLQIFLNSVIEKLSIQSKTNLLRTY